VPRLKSAQDIGRELRISWAVLAHLKGRGFLFHVLIQARTSFSSAWTLLRAERWSIWVVKKEKR
jgi:hypothetical protein